jgi:hypothetical protein
MAYVGNYHLPSSLCTRTPVCEQQATISLLTDVLGGHECTIVTLQGMLELSFAAA